MATRTYPLVLNSVTAGNTYGGYESFGYGYGYGYDGNGYYEDEDRRV